MMKIGRDRPQTDPSSVSDFGTDFSSTFVSRLLAFSSDSQFQLDQLIKTPFGLGPDFVSGIVSSIEPRISICIFSTRT